MLDRHLEHVVREMLAHDDRVRGLDVRADFDGGVAHLTGKVGSPARLDTVRALIGELAGVYAVWSRVRVAGVAPLTVDIGCGATKQYPESVGLDVRPTPAVDVVADLRYGLPFADGTVDTVFAVHVLEHLPDFLPLVDECHRVLRPTGTLHVMSPWWRHVNAVADPTHLRLFDVQTFKGICTRTGAPRWRPLHAGCDGASVFADLRPLSENAGDTGPSELARFFD